MGGYLMSNELDELIKEAEKEWMRGWEIGPTRMRYSRAITVVHGAAQAVSRMLRDPS